MDSWRQFTFEQLTSNDRTPLARMLPRVIGAELGTCNSGGILPLPAPAKQAQHAEAGSEERESGG